MESEVLRLVDRRWPDPFYATPKVVWEEHMDIISSNAFVLYHIYRYHVDSNTRAKELVQHFPEERVIDVIDWARTRDKPFGAAVHALEGGYPLDPKPREAPSRGPQWLPPIQRPNKKGDQYHKR